MEKTHRRHSKYVDAVRLSLAYFGHATNAMLAHDLRKSYPHISDTTVHRITQRLLGDGEIIQTQHAIDGAMVFDVNTAPHDHFQCRQCDNLRDISVPIASRRQIRSAIGPCRLDGSLTIVGTCQNCIKSQKEK